MADGLAATVATAQRPTPVADDVAPHRHERLDRTYDGATRCRHCPYNSGHRVHAEWIGPGLVHPRWPDGSPVLVGDRVRRVHQNADNDGDTVVTSITYVQNADRDEVRIGLGSGRGSIITSTDEMERLPDA